MKIYGPPDGEPPNFLSGTDEAYKTTWQILQERYGRSFVVAKAFRNNLTSWPRVGPKDSIDLRVLRLPSRLSSHSVLNDCGENQINARQAS